MTTQKIGIESVPLPVADVKAQAIEGELLLYHPAQTKAIYLNPAAAVIWGLCDGRRHAREIIALIRESYPDTNADLTDDVLLTLQQLCDDHVLVLS